jgi:hypothetical protein
LAHELAGQAHFDALMAPSFVTARVDREGCGRSHAGVLPVSAKSSMKKRPHQMRVSSLTMQPNNCNAGAVNGRLPEDESWAFRARQRLGE